MTQKHQHLIRTDYYEAPIAPIDARTSKARPLAKPEKSVVLGGVLFRDPRMSDHVAADIVRRVHYELFRSGLDLGVAAADEAADFSRLSIAQHEYRITVGIPDDLQLAVGKVLHADCALEIGGGRGGHAPLRQFLVAGLHVHRLHGSQNFGFHRYDEGEHMNRAVVGHVGNLGSVEAHTGEHAAGGIARFPSVWTRSREATVGGDAERRFEGDFFVFNASPDQQAVAAGRSHVRAVHDDADWTGGAPI